MIAALPLNAADRPPSPLTAAEERALKPKDSFRECDVCPEMVVVPAGSFVMGSPPNEVGRFEREGPQHRVAIARPFAVGKYEVTFAEWDACVTAGGCKHRAGHWQDRGRRPAIDVSWNHTQEYIAWLSRKTGKTYRLLSEAEWEYAARAGTTTPYWTGQTIAKSQANFDNPKGTIDVGSFPANPFGLHDMHGNVWEWVQDCWNDSYKGAPSDGSAWVTGDCRSRMVRGGTWFYHPHGLRSAIRGWNWPVSRGSFGGFRLARTLTS
jgi:formylglycine-generating enzyme required for sulfatase activity